MNQIEDAKNMGFLNILMKLRGNIFMPLWMRLNRQLNQNWMGSNRKIKKF